MVDVSGILQGLRLELQLEPRSVMTATLIEALTELEQLRTTVARWEAVAEALENVAKARVDSAESRLISLRTAARAYIDANPKCDALVRDEEPTPIGTSGWKTYGNHTCGKPATHQDISAWGGECPCPDVKNRCDEHAESIEEAPWAAALRALEEEMGKA